MDNWAMAWEATPGGMGNMMTFMGNNTGESTRFDQWRTKQQSDVLERGKSPIHDFSEEEKYLQRMIKSVLRSHVCYREVDEYASCLLKHKLVSDHDLAAKGIVDVNQRLAQEKCARQVAKYNACLDVKSNHQLVVQAATTHSRCEPKRKDFLICLRKWNKSPELQERNCYYGVYFPLLRCGLNALFDEYWKGVTGYSPAQEMHQYEMENDAKVRRNVGELRTKLEMENHLKVQ